MATILKRPGPRGKTVWQVQVRRKGYPAQIRTFDRKGDAEKWARSVEHRIEAGSWRDTREASRLTLSQALARYLDSVTSRKRPGSQVRDRLSARYLKSVLGRFSLLQVTAERVAQYRDERLKTVSANTVRIELALLSNLFKIAEREWSFRALENPVSKIAKPKIPEGRCPILSEEQIGRFLKECQESRTKLLYPFVLLALHTGARSQEIRGLRWSQVNLQEGFISLVGPETKGHRSRSIPLTGAAVEMLHELEDREKARKVVDFNGNPVGLLFPARGDATKGRDLHMSFNRAVRRASLDNLPGFGKLRIHDLRHLCGTYLVMNGVDLETIRDVLGHRDLSTTQRYLHVVNGHKKKAIARIGHLGFGTSGSHNQTPSLGGTGQE